MKRNLLLKALAISYCIGSSEYRKLRKKLESYGSEVWARGLEKQKSKVKHLLLRWSDCNRHPCCNWVRESSNLGGSKLVVVGGGEREQSVKIPRKPVLQMEFQLSMRSSPDVVVS